MAKSAFLRTAADWEALYHQLGQLIADEPAVLDGKERGTGDLLRWLGRADALIEEVGGIVDHARFRTLRDKMLTATLTDAESQMRHIRGLLYASLAKAELNAPSATKGAFIPA